MKGRHFILLAIGMLCWVASAKATIFIHHNNGVLTAWTTQTGVSGYKGCDHKELEKMPPYVFKLQQRMTSTQSACSIAPGERWLTIATRDSYQPRVVFNNIAEGQYRVVCHIAKAIGCVTQPVDPELPNRSVVYEREQSAPVTITDRPSNHTALGDRQLRSNEMLVYPNPAINEITIRLKATVTGSTMTISVIDVLGQLVYHREEVLEHSGGFHQWQINSKTLPAGTYAILLRDEAGKLWQQKVLIAR